MNRSRIFIRVAFTFLLFAFLLGGCNETPKLGQGDFFNMRKVSLTESDQEFCLEAVRNMLSGKSYKEDKEEHPILFSQETRAAFVVLPRPNEFALVSFGVGQGIMGALEEACTKMKRIAKNEDISRLSIRLDIVDETMDIRDYKVSSKWRDRHRDTQGIIFDTVPPIGLLPDEIISRNVIDHKGRFYRKRLREIVKDRGIGTRVLEAFVDDKDREKQMTVGYCRFTRISFMDGEKGPKTLLNGRPGSFAIDDKTLLDAAKNAGEYLKSIIHADGSYSYIYYPNMNRDGKSYNLLRHAGTTYALTELYEVTGDKKLLEKIKLAHRYLLDRIEGPNGEDKAKGIKFQALFNKRKGEAKAGGAALTIIALAKYTTVTGDKQYVPLMQDIARFILHQTEENGHLISKYYRKKPAKEKPFDSIYYPGECVLALTRLYELDGDKTWVDGASKLVDYMVYERDKELALSQLPHDHWLCIGINELYPIVKKEDYKEHAFKIGESIYQKMRKDGPRADWVGSFYTPPRSTPSATRNEGIIALYKLADKLGEPTDKWYDAAQKIARFDLRMQVTPITGMFFKHPDKAYGAYPRSFVNPEIRIDYVQHNLSALLGLWSIQLKKQGKSPEDFMTGKKKVQGQPLAEKPAA